MKQNRRNFLLQSSAAVLGTMAVPFNGIAKSNFRLPLAQNQASPEDESYWKLVRQQFPLQKDWAYLNNGTMGPSPYPVIEAVRKGMLDGDMYGNYGGWETTAAKLAQFVGAEESEIALTHNVTDGINIVCNGLPLKKGDEVILTTHEHVGNALPWLNRQRIDGIVIKVFTPASTADETVARIKSLLTKKTKAIAIPHIPCTQGQILPAREICDWAKANGLFAIIDGAHGPGMLQLNLHEMNCDAYISCCHKWMLGPKGTGFLYVKKDFQNTLESRMVGGGSDNAKWNMATVPISSGALVETAHKYYGGTQALGLYRGVDAAIDFIEQIGMHSIYERIHYLGSYTQQELLKLGGKVELVTPTEAKSRCAVNGFRIKGVDINDFYKTCVDHKVRIRVVHENGLNALRVSTHIYNNKGEVDKLVSLIKGV